VTGAAPDLCEPVVGYRAWHLADDGVLRPWSFPEHPWEPGVTTASCARVPGHPAPVTSCSCGLYALSDPSDRRLNFSGDQAIGAIAAWGDLEVHRTGFRAQHACVVALAVPDRAGAELVARLEAAAARHRVALVPARSLSAEARRHGAPLSVDAVWGGPVRGAGAAAPPIDPATVAEPARGLVPDAHLWVETALGCVAVGLTRQLGAALGTGALQVDLAEPGAQVAAGDRLGSVSSAAGTFVVWAPVSGTVLAVNPRLARDARVAAADPEGAGWLARLLPSAWAAEAGACAWGPRAALEYAAALARDAAHGDAFADVRLERLRVLPSVASWSGVLEALRQERARPRFPDAAAVRDGLVAPVAAALDADPALRRRLGRLGLRVAFELRDVGTALVLDLRDGGAAVVEPGACGRAELRLSSTADALHAWLTGRLDPAVALRRGDLRSSRPRGETLRALAVLKHLRLARHPPAPSWAPPAWG